MTILRVQEPDHGLPGHVRATLAGLPARLRPAPDGPLRWVDGGTGWTARAGAELQRGARGLLVDAPAPAPVTEVEALRDAAARTGVVVAVASPFVLSPAWAACRAELAEDRPAITLLDVVAVATDPADLDRSMLASVAVVRPLLRGTSLRRAVPGLATSLVTCAGELAVTLTATVSVRSGMALTAVAAYRRWQVDLPGDGTARPGRAVVCDAAGTRAGRPVYATGARSAWMSLHAAVTAAAPPAYGLDDVLADMLVVEGR
jgi:hypothetical protein